MAHFLPRAPHPSTQGHSGGKGLHPVTHEISAWKKALTFIISKNICLSSGTLYKIAPFLCNTLLFECPLPGERCHAVFSPHLPIASLFWMKRQGVRRPSQFPIRIEKLVERGCHEYVVCRLGDARVLVAASLDEFLDYNRKLWRMTDPLSFHSENCIFSRPLTYYMHRLCNAENLPAEEASKSIATAWKAIG